MFNHLFIILMVVHIVLALGYLIIKSRKNKSQALCEFLIVLLVPGFGLLLLLGLQSTRLWRLMGEDPSYMYQEFQNDRLILGEVSRQEADIIPIEDVLTLDDTQTKRELIGEAIKRDILHNNNILFKAVRDSDSEVAHYAVSVVTARIKDIEMALFDAEKKLQEHPSDVAALKQYADAMGTYLKIGFLDEISRQKNAKAYVDVLGNLLALDVTEKKYFIEKIHYELEAENYTAAELFCEMFLRHFTNDEDPYIMYIKLYSKMKDYRKMQEKINQLKASPIRFTNNALEIIRFWDGGEQRV